MTNRLSTLIRYHEEDPDDSFVRFALASEYVKLGNEEEARSWFEGLTEHDPNYVGTYYHLGKLYERAGENERATETYRTGIGIAGQIADFHARSELQSALLELEAFDLD